MITIFFAIHSALHAKQMLWTIRYFFIVAEMEIINILLNINIINIIKY